MSRHIGAANYNGDFCSDAVILEPYPACDELRRLSPVVWMAQQVRWAVIHDDAVRTALETTGSCAKCGPDSSWRRAIISATIFAERGSHA